MNRKNKKAGFVITAELIFISTIMVLGLLTGYVALRDAMIGELHDVGMAIGALNQSYTFTGTSKTSEGTFTSGTLWTDAKDTGDDGQGYNGTYSVQVPADPENM